MDLDSNNDRDSDSAHLRESDIILGKKISRARNELPSAAQVCVWFYLDSERIHMMILSRPAEIGYSMQMRFTGREVAALRKILIKITRAQGSTYVFHRKSFQISALQDLPHAQPSLFLLNLESQVHPFSNNTRGCLSSSQAP